MSHTDNPTMWGREYCRQQAAHASLAAASESDNHPGSARAHALNAIALTLMSLDPERPE